MLLYFWTFFAIALESFPVSSSGQALLLTKLSAFLSHQEFLEIPACWDHLLHGATVLILPLVFFKSWFPLIYLKRSYPIIFKLLYLGFIVDALTALIYFVVEFYEPTLPLWIGFFITGCLLYSLRFCTKTNARWDWRLSILLGCAQGLALLPGISRLGITYVIARWYGIKPQKAVEISFLIEWPIALAGFIKGLYYLKSSAMMQQLLNLPMLLVMVGAMMIMYLGLKFFLAIVLQGKVWLFSYIVWGAAAIALIFNI